MTLSEEALVFATEAHKDQVRKYTFEPYIVHPMEVADIIRTIPHDEAMLAAAYLHDVVEDCDVPLFTIFQRFGADVGEHVYFLTDISSKSDGNRAFRKQMDRDHIERAPGRTQSIKVADLISNTKSITAHDPDFARVYMKEKTLTLNILTKADTSLLVAARLIIAEYNSTKTAA
jgi:(p)ppGpp synthase/HD superfamily hydrolase